MRGRRKEGRKRRIDSNRLSQIIVESKRSTVGKDCRARTCPDINFH
jgi:hypothetical protein